MIRNYIQTGVKSNILRPNDLEFFDFLRNFKPIRLQNIKSTEKGIKPIKDKTKFPTVKYVIRGEFTKHVRAKENLISDDLIAIDIEPRAIEGTEGEHEELALDDVLEGIKKLSGYELAYFHTMNSTPGYTRMRIFIKPSRPMNEKEKKLTTQKVMEILSPLPIDISSGDYARVQSLPVYTGLIDDFKVHYQEGKPFEVVETDEVINELEMPLNDDYDDYSDIDDIIVPIEDDDAIKAFKAYVEFDKDNLSEENLSKNVIFVLAKAVENKEITHEAALQCCEIMAMGNSAWEEGNLQRLKYELQYGTQNTKYTFAEKFIQIPNALSKNEIKTMEELYEILREQGKAWRLQNRTIVKSTGEIKEKPVTARVIADIIQKFCKCVLINEDDPETSPLSIYDYDEGIYKKGERFVQRLMLEIERNSTKSSRYEAIQYLTIESAEAEKTQDMNLVVVNNGIYNKKTRKLEPFTHEKIFVNKIATNYIEGATEPNFPDWKFSEWLKELSDGDEEKHKLLKQMFATAVNSNYVSEVAFLLVSNKGSTGKSTLERLLMEIVGIKNTASLKIAQFERPFQFAIAYGKSLLIGDDNDPNFYLDSSQNFKSVCTGEIVQIESKGKQPFSTLLTPCIVQSMNGYPRFRDTTHGLTRRLRVIEFNHQFVGEKKNRAVKDVYIKDKQLHEYILFESLQVNLDEIVDTKESREAIYNLRKDNDPVYEFYDEVVTGLESTRLPSNYLFYLFQAWSYSQNNPTKLKQRGFTSRIKELLLDDGWRYEPKNMRTEDYLTKEDIDLIGSFSGRYELQYEHEPNKRQGCYFKE